MPRRQRNIYYRKCDGRFEGRYIKGYENGKARYGAVYGKKYSEVKDKLAAAKPSEAETKMSAVSLARQYLERRRQSLKPSTCGIYERYISNHIEPFFGDGELTRETAQNFTDALTRGGLSVKTAKSVFSFLRAAAGVTGLEVSFPKQPKREMAVFSAAEQKRIEAAAEASNDIDRVGVILCLYTGIRVGELTALHWSDVDIENGRLYIRRTLQRIKRRDGERKTELALMPPKSGSSERVIPLAAFLTDMLAEHKEKAGGQYVISRNGKPIEPRNFQYRFKNILIKAGVDKGSPHSCRHSFCTRALESGADIKTIADIVGHRSPVTTMAYAHSIDAHKRASMENLAAYVRG